MVEEAATDMISLEQGRGILEPWKQSDFIEKIVQLQKQRQIETTADEVQFYDRSPICTLALSRYLGYLPSDSLLEELQRIEHESIYHRQVFFLDNLGFVQPTEARKISFENALIFQQIHKEVYTELNYELVLIPPEPLSQRAQRIIELTRQ